MSAIVFETPGEIDLRAFTVMGMSAKLGDNPIGKFGTGLKYAIACLVRLGAEPKVFIGKDEFVFYKERTTFRTKEFDLVRMRAKRFPQRLFKTQDLPFTTEYGKFWQPWQVYRELEANTRDEAGKSWHDTSPIERIVGWPGRTRIAIDHQSMFDAWEARSEVFLPGASSKASEQEVELEVFPGPSNFLYWRGMKVFELSRPSMFTYNLLKDMELTEDRTLKYEFYAREALGDFVQKSNDRAFVKQIVTAKEEHWEHWVDFTSWRRPSPSVAWLGVLREKPQGLLLSARKRFLEIEPQEASEQRAMAHPAPWRVRGEYVEDAEGIDIFHRPSQYPGDWTAIAQKIVEGVNQQVEVPEMIETEERAGEPSEEPEYESNTAN